MRVPTEANIADDPSRERYELLEKLGAIRRQATLEPAFVNAQCWEHLSLKSSK